MAMRERQKAIVRLFWKRFSMLVLILLIAAASVAVLGVYKKERESRELRMQAESQLRDLREQEQNLGHYISKLKTDRGKEEALREQYGVGREGEGLIVIVDPAQPEPVRATSTVREWVRKFLPFW